MQKINIFRIYNKVQEILEYNFSDIIKANRILLFSNYLQEDKKIIINFLKNEYQKLGYNEVKVITDYNEVGQYSFFIYTDIKSYNLSFQETMVSCEIGQHTILDIALKFEEVNNLLDKYRYASKNYEEDIKNLVDSYNLTLTMANKSNKFYIQFSVGNKMNLYSKGKLINEDKCLIFSKYYSYYDYLCVEHWLKKRMEEDN